jgi:hypothetical protein
MSRRTIRALDQFCDVTNWANSLEHALPEEIVSWHTKWKRARENLRSTIAALTPDEWNYLEKKFNYCYAELRRFKTM